MLICTAGQRHTYPNLSDQSCAPANFNMLQKYVIDQGSSQLRTLLCPTKTGKSAGNIISGMALTGISATEKRHLSVCESASERRREFQEYKATLSCHFCGAQHPAIIDFHHTEATGDKKVSDYLEKRELQENVGRD